MIDSIDATVFGGPFDGSVERIARGTQRVNFLMIGTPSGYRQCEVDWSAPNAPRIMWSDDKEVWR